MANCTSPCTGSVTDLLRLKLDLEIAIFYRLSQVVQAFGGQPVVDLPAVGNIPCTGSRLSLFTALLVQKQANFNMLQQVLLAA